MISSESTILQLSGYLIWILERLGLARDVYRFPPDVQARRFSDRENVVAGTADRS